MSLESIKIDKCPYCGHTEFGNGFQRSSGKVVSSTFRIGQGLHHIICLNCGSVVRSYVEDPDKFKLGGI